MRGAEVDAIGTCVQDTLHEGRDVLRSTREREPVEHVVRNHRAGGRVVTGRQPGADGGREMIRQTFPPARTSGQAS